MLSVLTKPITFLGATRNLLKFNGQFNLGVQSAVKMSSQIKYESLSVTIPKEYVVHVELNRPKQVNAMNRTMWIEIKQCFEHLNNDPNCRVIILSGSGKLFTAGLDLKDAVKIPQELAKHDDIARKAKVLANLISLYQSSITSLELCKKPVLAAVHSACVGAGVDIITASDMRYCTKDAWFQVKETEIGLAADVGTLQRLPKVIGSDSLARELCYTARKFSAAEALSAGLVSRVFEDKESMIKGVLEIAENISKKSPVAVQSTKVSMVYARDHSVQEGLNQMLLLNQLMLQSEDFVNATVAQLSKDPDIKFSKL